MTPTRRLRIAALGGALLMVIGGGAALADDAGSTPGDGPDSSAQSSAPAVTGDASTAGPDGADAPAGQVKVIVTSPDGPAAAAAAVKAAGGTVDATLDLIGGVSADVPTAAVPSIQGAASVTAVSNDSSLTLTTDDGAVPSDDSGTMTPAQIATAIGADRAYARGLDGTGVDVAVLDTGIVPVNGLSGPHAVLGADLSSESDSPLRGLDGFGHGTAMAGIIGATGPSSFRGIAPGSRIISVKVGAADGSVDVSQVIAGIDWVVQHKDDAGVHIRVLNISFGTESAQDADLDPLAYAADVAWRHGIVVVTSVGNDGRTDRRVADPAIGGAVLAVGAADTHVDSPGTAPSVAPFSSLGNRNRHADLLAPGVHVLSLRDPGSTLDQAFPEARRGTDFFRGSGTSQAAAVVSGAVALLLEGRPLLRPDEVKALLVKSAQHIQQAPANTQGAGVIDLGSALDRKVPKNIDVPDRLHGTGSIEASRGSVHMLRDGVPVAGEQTVLGVPWKGKAWAKAAWLGSTWQGSTWQGSTWSGSTWQGRTWQGSTWQGSTWQGSTWKGSTWQGSTWQGSTWQGSTWQGSTWQGSTWQGSTWQGSTWQGSTWQGSTWQGSGWAGSTWT